MVGASNKSIPENYPQFVAPRPPDARWVSRFHDSILLDNAGP